MATVKEMMAQDAAASIQTTHMMSVGDTFEGNLDGASDEDWVAVELEAGNTDNITLAGRGDAGAAETVLKLYDSKGGMIASNDDVDGAAGDLSSALEFAPEEDGTYYISAGSYARIPGVDNSGDYSINVAQVVMVTDITGTAGADKITGTDAGEELSGLGVNDSLDGGGWDNVV